MANTIFDTDFQPDDEVLLYEGSRFHWSGKVGDMMESENVLKYLLRAGRKDALDIELGKAENYLHHALTGEWLSEEGNHGIEAA